jgi:hypothetical protein
LFVVILASARHAAAQISPGALSRAHQDLEGATKCTTCHNFGLGNRGFKCLDCHTEIQRRVEEKHGYHARAYNVSRGQTDCVRCHAEHNGKQFQITKLNRTGFDHAGLTDFPLLGKHKTLACETCHGPKLLPAAARSEIKLKDPNKSFLGLGTECTACHMDAHAGQLGAECQRCHSQEVWKPAAAFDHNRTLYPLTGRHQSVDCQKCHAPAQGQTAARYKGLTFSGCQNCHMDPHHGAFQEATFRGNCESCHSTVGWKMLRTDSGFDHQKTKFPLNGKHAELDCFKCHKNSDFHQPVAHERCSDCHEDIHHGEFRERAAGSDCSACHTERSFKPSLFTRETHQKSVFPLQGKHAPLDCAKCHLPTGKDAHYKLGTLTCVECHKDPHAGQFGSAPNLNRCEACHTQNTFKPSTFSLARHAQTKFALTGAHVAVLCQECHQSISGADSVAARRYHFSDLTCTACHLDPHHTQQSCETCHNTRQWKEVRPFDHGTTQFPLEGAHQTATCIGCHRPLPVAANAKVRPTADFFRTPRQCFECHEDIHGGQFMSSGSEKDCSSCHSITKWNAGSFDHSKTSFPLDGAHDKVRCARCHRDQMEREGRQIRLYRGTPTQCSGCHAAIGK